MRITCPQITGDQYLGASPDPVASFSSAVCGHMNEGHKEDNIALASHFLKLSGVTSMRMLDLDKLGVNVEVGGGGHMQGRLGGPVLILDHDMT
jgi:hypothetical protein